MNKPNLAPTKDDLFDPEQLDAVMHRLLGAEMTKLVSAIEAGDAVSRHQAEQVWAAAAIEALDIQLEMVGLDRIDPLCQYLVAPLHEGFADVLALLQLPLRLSWVIRDELLDLPHFGEYLRAAGHIAIEPEAPRAALRTILRELPPTIASGLSPVVFPQGSLLGLEVSFQPGAFQLADRYELPVLPVVLTGSHQVWDYPFGRLLRRGQRIRLELLEPVPPGTAVARMHEIEMVMKSRALEVTDAPARHYVPERDGLWEGYRFQLD
jgi:1-acyl-sn-glycerol-3-phosphate acyltransferase